MIRLGICTRYCRHEAAYVALRIATWIEDNGGSVSFLSASPNASCIDARFDDRVYMPPSTKFTDWVQQKSAGLEAILWTHVPRPVELEWVKAQGLKTYVVPLWEELDSSVAPGLAAAHRVLHPLKCATAHYRQRGLENGVHIPWDTGEPFVRACDPDPGEHPRILLPLVDGAVRKIDGGAVAVFLHLLAELPAISGTVMYSASTIGSPALRMLKRFATRFPERLQLHGGVTPAYRPMIFSRHALALWPSTAENTCMLGLSLVGAGVPIVTNSFPATVECFGPEHGVLVPAALGLDAERIVKVAETDHIAMGAICRRLLVEPENLGKLRTSVLSGLAERRASFQAAMQFVFGGDA